MEERSLRLFPGQRVCGNGNMTKDEVSAVGWQKRVLFRSIQRLSTIDVNSARIQLYIHTGAKRRGREEESVDCRSGTGNVGGEDAQVLLGRGGKDLIVHLEPDWGESC